MLGSFITYNSSLRRTADLCLILNRNYCKISRECDRVQAVELILGVGLIHCVKGSKER